MSNNINYIFNQNQRELKIDRSHFVVDDEGYCIPLTKDQIASLAEKIKKLKESENLASKQNTSTNEKEQVVAKRKPLTVITNFPTKKKPREKENNLDDLIHQTMNDFLNSSQS